MSRQNFYARRRARQRAEVDRDLVIQLVVKERQTQPRLGTRKLQHVLQRPLGQAGVKLGRDRFFKLLRENRLLVEPLPREWLSTTNSGHDLPVHPNLIAGLKVRKPNEVWVADLTYVRTEEGFLFLSLVTDKSSRKIVGYHCAESLATAGCAAALRMALAGLPKGSRPIHHSDRGTQYCSHEYGRMLGERGLARSMTEKNHCAENALAERMNGILKGEYGLGGRLPDKDQARKAVRQAVYLYNECRPHGALKFRTPGQVHKNTDPEAFNEKKEEAGN
jgi:putative transposase